MNWSLRQYQSTIDNKSEQSAMFEGSTILKTQEALNSASYTASGKLVSDYLKKYKRSWADSLVAGSSGSCKFATQTVKQTAGTLTNVLKAGCTYASSDESVAIVDGSALKIVNAGFVILTANDGSKSIVIVEKEPAQTVAGFVDFRCRIGGSCNQSKSMANLTGSSDNEAILVATNKTAQGGTLTITSLDPSIVSVKWATCTGDKCYGNKGKSIYIAEFKKLGTTKLVATAPAVTGYRALSDTIEVIYAKGLQRIHSKFKSQTIPLGGTAESALPDTMMDDRIPVSYTYNSKESTPYFTKVGTSIVAGNQNAIVTVTATAPETDSFEEFTKSVTIIIGDSSLAVNKEDFYGPNPIKGVSVPGVPFRAAFRNSGMLLHVPSAGLVEWGIYSAAGVCFQKEAKVYSAGSHLISLENLPAGSYLVKIRQGNITRTSRWNKF